MKSAIEILGTSAAEFISLADFKYAYCGIMSYYSSGAYVYQMLGTGLALSPAIWHNFIRRVLDEIPDHKHHYTIIDDSLIY